MNPTQPNQPMYPSNASLPQQPTLSQQAVPLPAAPVALPMMTPAVPIETGLTITPSVAGAQVPPTEEAWARAAEHIIETTKDDPYEQTEQLYQLRVQFMQQVHNRELKQKETDA